MKSTGIVRKLDHLGRLVLPMELRKVLNLNVKDSLEIYTDEDSIILRKYQHSCCICGKDEELVSYKGKSVCRRCINMLNRISDY